MADIILDKQDLTYLEWSRVRHSSGTAGSFLKSTEETDGKKIYYKLSDYDSVNGITGHECVNELIADRLLNVLGINHLHYRLINADIVVNGKKTETFLCASEDYKIKGEEKIALDVYYDMNRQNGESPLEFCIRNGWQSYIYEMLVVDYLILNRDRHGANIEVLRNPKRKTIRLAPLFDHGLSFLCRCTSTREIQRFDVTEDKKIQCFVGSCSSKNNLELIPGEKLPSVNRLTEKDRQYIFDGLDKAAPDELLNKIWNMLWTRWQCYEDFCTEKRV